MRTVVDLIQRLEPLEDRFLVVYGRRGQETLRRSYAEVVRRARAIAAKWLEEGLAPGQILFLQYPNSAELVEGILGAISVGLVPCCLASARALGGLDVFQERMRVLFTAFPDALLVAPSDVGEEAGVRTRPLPEVTAGDPPAPLVEAGPADLAFVQLTSGSTQHPKAVRITHGALVANVGGIEVAGGGGEFVDAFVNWLPLYHDMGLVGSFFCALFTETDLHLMLPDTFLARPNMWLQVISDVPGRSISPAPNSAFAACVQRVPSEAVTQLDLSRWRLAPCGGERVRPETLAAFAEHFAPAGFRPEVFVPCFGMAETTLAVTFGSGGRPPLVRDGNVSCGRPVQDTEVVIRDREGVPLPEGSTGEITVSGPGLCSGYLGAAESPIREGWLRTGDRGYLHDGELYVTGRFKDTIIVDGVNYDPDEFEAVGEDVVQVVGGRSAAIGVDVDGRERVVLVNEVTPQDDTVLEKWASEIGDRIARLFGFGLYDLVFVRRGALGKTSSGKVQRSKLRGQYARNELDRLWNQGPGQGPAKGNLHVITLGSRPRSPQSGGGSPEEGTHP